MVTQKICRGGTVLLRQIELSDCTPDYVAWLNDPQVNAYLETRWEEQNLAGIQKFVALQRENEHSFLFAIIVQKGKKHIGNIKIGPANRQHQYADISYFIGEKAFWNKGIATEAIHLVCQFGFQEMGLRKIVAGTYATAVGSQRALEKNGFLREGICREQVVSGGGYVDVYRYGILKREFKDFYR